MAIDKKGTFVLETFVLKRKLCNERFVLARLSQVIISLDATVLNLLTITSQGD